ncbi:MAG: tRNA lysidine(34) synthetase TilS [Elusimicrobiota bacterium]|jgi:tRNA(Ile)-lysidine synthase
MTTEERALRKTLDSRLAAFDRAEGLLRPGDRVLAAVSGGPDSVLLALHLARLAPKKRLKLALAHFHHGLRGAEADRDAASVRRLAARLGLPLFERRLGVARAAREEGRSVEDAGRLLRYRALAELARAEGFDKVATGHHLDDQAETLLLHLLRGTRAKGLGGIPPRRALARTGPGAKVLLVRPLLPLRRTEIRACLRALGQGFRLDRSNLREHHTRNWVRRRVLPLLEKRNPRIREGLAAIASDIRRIVGE